MKAFCVISPKKQSGKTYISSIAISSLMSVKRSVAYYKPFIMNVLDNKLPDIDYIKRTTSMNVSDIYTSFACSGNISPMHSTDIAIDHRDILDLFEEISYKYDVMVLEALGLYDPISEGYTFSNLILDMPKSIETSVIAVVEYNANIISQTLGLVEQLHSRKLKTSMIIINQTKELLIDYKVIEYLRDQLDPINVFSMTFENNAGTDKILAADEKYSDILDAILLT